MVKTMSESLDMSFKRVQFTPDLMPGDIVGTEILEEDHERARSSSNLTGALSSRMWCLPMK